MCYRCGKITPGDGPRTLLIDENEFVYRVGPNGSTATAIDNDEWERLTEWPGFSKRFFDIRGRVDNKWMRWKQKEIRRKIQRRLNRGGYVSPFLLADAGIDRGGG